MEIKHGPLMNWIDGPDLFVFSQRVRETNDVAHLDWLREEGIDYQLG